MSRRRKEDYSRVLTTVKKLLPRELNVEEIVADFEAAAWQAVKDIMPDVYIHGCCFHWCNAAYRQVGSLGLMTAYQDLCSD